MPMTFNRRKLFRDAWAYAKAFAAFDGRSPRSLIADALRKVWAEAKALAARAARAVQPLVSPATTAPVVCSPAFIAAASRHQARLGAYYVKSW